MHVCIAGVARTSSVPPAENFPPVSFGIYYYYKHRL